MILELLVSKGKRCPEKSSWIREVKLPEGKQEELQAES